LQTPEQSYGSGVFFVLLATLGWSLSGVFVRIMPELNGWQLNCWRGYWMAVALMIYLVAVYGRGTLQKFREIPRVALFASALFFALGSTLYVTSLTMVGTATVSVIGATSPLFAGLLSPWVTGEKPGFEAWIAAGLALFGVAVIAWDGLETGRALGLFLSICVPMAFAGQTLALRRYRNVDMVPAICLGGVMSFFIAGIMGFTADHAGGGFNVGFREILLLAAMATLQLAIPLIFYIKGARSVPAVTLTLISMLDAVINPFWPWIFVGENPGRAALIGGSIIVGAVLISVFGRKIFDSRATTTDAVPSESPA
jgi:drug/metabolite transporter (DMT)-like permease